MSNARSGAAALRTSLVLPLLLCGLSACGGGSSSAGDTGFLKVTVTDAPFPAEQGCVTAAWVEITGLRARGDRGWTDLPLAADAPMTRVDLLQLRAGLSEQLAQVSVPTGAYTEVRLLLDGAELEFGSGAPARAFKVPSGATSGLKIKIDPPLMIAAGQESELLLDVDLTRSFRTTGLGGEPTCAELEAGAGGVLFRPVIRAINRDESALLRGLVLDAEEAAIAGAEVTVREAGATTAGDPHMGAITADAPGDAGGPEEGAFAFALAPGAYDLYVRLQGESAPTLSASGVSLSAGEARDINLQVP